MTRGSTTGHCLLHPGIASDDGESEEIFQPVNTCTLFSIKQKSENSANTEIAFSSVAHRIHPLTEKVIGSCL
jgi:hypothetical protein